VALTTDQHLKAQRSTIHDVAAEAEVSISTVSLVMNDKSGVGSATRDRVLRAAQRLEYVPTQAARRLALQRTSNIGFVVREDHFSRSEPFYTRVFLGTEFEARLHSFYVLLTTIPTKYSSLEHTPRFLRERNVDGVLVAGKVDSEFIDEVRALDLPVVLIDYETDTCPAVMIDNQNGARAAVNHLIERGHRHIAFLGAEMDHPGIRSRQEGYRLALAAANIDALPEWIITSDTGTPTFKTGTELAEQMLDLAPRATAVFCANDAMALGVLEKARQRGLRVPEDLAVAGFDDVPAAASALPTLTTVRVFKEQLGELALRTLVDLMAGEQDEKRSYARSSHSIKLTTELVVRDST
jgi:LacI family transcriptional regulator